MSTSGVQRFVALPPAPDSARQARRFVNEVLTAAGARDFVHTAALLTSELVTNGIVHARTELQVTVEATPEWVRVEVVDGNPRLPSRREYDEDALTGRGLEMVELLAADFGTSPLEDDGKRVWFRLGSAPSALRSQAASAGRDVDADADERSTVLLPVQLLNLPIALYCAWQQHADAMLREATLTALDARGSDPRGGAVPEDFGLANEALAVLASTTTDVFAFRESGADHVDIELRMPRAAAVTFPVLRDVLRHCSVLSMAGELLVPPSLPEIQAVRNWVCDEVNRQIAGLDPHPWEELLGDDLPLDPVSADAVEEIRTSPVAKIAADRGNRILAASAAAGRLLGWPAAELEGHRLVTIIPPRLRDVHVAGFTSQLLGGSDRIIGRAVEVPALRRDGTEVTVQLAIERRKDANDHSFFVATLTEI